MNSFSPTRNKFSQSPASVFLRIPQRTFGTSLCSSAALIKHRVQQLPQLISNSNEQEVPAHKEKAAKVLIYVPRIQERQNTPHAHSGLPACWRLLQNMCRNRTFFFSLLFFFFKPKQNRVEHYFKLHIYIILWMYIRSFCINVSKETKRLKKEWPYLQISASFHENLHPFRQTLYPSSIVLFGLGASSPLVSQQLLVYQSLNPQFAKNLYLGPRF